MIVQLLKQVRPPDGKWGAREENGSWNGMVGMVKRKEVDFALGPIGVIYDRKKVWLANKEVPISKSC